MKKNSTVTVAISAYNEEKNIASFIESVLKQKEEGFVLEKIWIFSDGSIDDTVKIARSYKNKKIKVFDSRIRLGKSSRLNTIYKKLRSDFLIQSDADVIFAHQYIIRDMIKPLIKEKGVGMCGGNPLPIKGKTFTEKAVNCSVEAFIPLRKILKGGNNIFSVDGRILSYKKELVRKINIPEIDVTSNDAYTFYACLTLGYQYRFVESGIVLFRSPQTIKDQIKQNTRFLAMPIKMSRYFDPKLVRRERSIPKLIMARQIIKVFIKHPILSTYIYILNRFCKFRVLKAETRLTARWPMAYSTKNLNMNN